MNFPTSELATILAALRYFQQDMEENESPPICHHFADCNPLTPDEIDSLCERLNFHHIAPPAAYYKVRPTNDNLSFIAWAALTPLTTEDHHTDPAEPVHFQFAATPELAVSKLLEEMDAAYGKRTWIRQHSDTDSATKAMLRKVLSHMEFITTHDDQGRLEQTERWHQDHEPLRRQAETLTA